MRAIRLVAAALAAIAAPASAAFEISVSGVSATGVRTQTFGPGSSCAPAVVCPDLNTPYSTTVSGTLSPLVQNLNGAIDLSGQDRPLSSFGVNLFFSGGQLITSVLSGQVKFGPSINGSDDATFRASNLGVTVRNTVTGQTSFFAPVPEPETWLLVLLGFGAIGTAMRRRPTVAYATRNLTGSFSK
jgi:hypothetical protein